LDSSRALGGASAEGSAAAVEELSDAAFLALAAHSTTAAEATAAAVEAVAGGVGEAVQLDSLLDIQRLRANMEVGQKRRCMVWHVPYGICYCYVATTGPGVS
jgi:hypothetical protein